MQGFFRLENTAQAAQPVVDHNNRSPNPNIPNSYFGDTKKPREKVLKKPKPWDQQTLRFKATSTPSKHDERIHHELQTPPPPVAASSVQGLLTPYTPSNAPWSGQYSLNSSTYAEYATPMSPISPTIARKFVLSDNIIR